MTVKCLFCKDTKIEPGFTGPCVWCEDLAAIAPKYEDVVAQRDAALGREAALREELDKWQGIAARRTGERTEFINERDDARNERDALQQRLTVAEQLLRDAKFLIEHSSYRICGASALIFGIDAALKPAAEGEGS